jgi:hypothetical protein
VKRTKLALNKWLTAFEDARSVMGVEAAMDRAACVLHEAHGVLLEVREEPGRLAVSATLPSGAVVEATEATYLTPTTRLRLTAMVLSTMRVRDLG